MQRVAEPHAVEEILDDGNGLVEGGEDRDEQLSERVGPDGLRFEDPLDRVVQHGGEFTRD